MKTLLAVTEPFIKRETGRLRGPASAGSTVVIPVDSSQGVAVADFVVVGFEGNELAEMCAVTAVANTTVTVATLKFNHTEGEPFVVYRFNQRKFYGATSAAGTFTELTADGSPKDISVDDPQGTYLEYSGSSYTYFKATYYNSVTSDETDVDEADSVAGDESLRYTSIYAIRKHSGLAGNPRYSDMRIEMKRKQAENEINSTLAAKYVLPLAEVPAILNQICELLAAGYIDYEEFGKDGEGAGWLASGRAQLKAIQKGTQILIGADGTELTRNAKVGVLDGYPNDEDTDIEKFSMADRY
jgi:phage gp36-like protein